MKTLKILISIVFSMFIGAIAALFIDVNPGIAVFSMLSLNVGYNLAVANGFILPFARFGLLSNFASLEWSDGQDNIPGVSTIAYFAPKSSIDNFPEPIDEPANFGENAKLESAPGFTFTTGGWYKIYGTEGTGKVDFESQGEPDCQSFLNRFTFIYPGTEAEAKALCRKLNNTDVVFMAVEFDGTKVLIGHPRIGTKFTLTGTTGDQRTSQKGCTIEVNCTHEVPAPVYEGDITLADASS
jgi:hypothetical protein